MKQIDKGPEPASLTTHRLTAHCNYGNYPAKDELREALVAEQGALCCYCMRRIYADTDSMKIEHWRCQDNYSQDQLRYQNLLGGCKGGEGLPRDQQHCDTRKGNADLKFNPADPAHHVETWISYAAEGSIHASDDIFNRQLNDVLNLNLPEIKNNRKSAWDAVLAWWKSEKNRLHCPPSKERLEQEIERRTKHLGSLSPYCQVAVYLLKLKLARMSG